MTKQEFSNAYYPLIVKNTQGTGLFPQVVLAQMAAESSWGTSANANSCNNFFGIKKGSWTGAVCTLNTPKDAKKASEFRKYNSAEDSIVDYIKVMLNNKRYAKALQAKSPEEQAQLISQAGYAENGEYAKLLISIMKNLPNNIATTVKENPGISTLSLGLIAAGGYYTYKKRKEIKKKIRKII